MSCAAALLLILLVNPAFRFPAGHSVQGISVCKPLY
jgi:hypothetical protein